MLPGIVKDIPTERPSNRILRQTVSEISSSVFSELMYKYNLLTSYSCFTHLDWISAYDRNHVLTVLYRIYITNNHDDQREAISQFKSDEFRQYLNSCTELDFALFLRNGKVTRYGVEYSLIDLIKMVTAFENNVNDVLTPLPNNFIPSPLDVEKELLVEEHNQAARERGPPISNAPPECVNKGVDYYFPPITRIPPPKLVIYAVGAVRTSLRQLLLSNDIPYVIADQASHPYGYDKILCKIPAVKARVFEHDVVVTDSPNNLACGRVGITLFESDPPDECTSHSLAAMVDPERLDVHMNFVRPIESCKRGCGRCGLSAVS